jgi:hypothetical protein
MDLGGGLPVVGAEDPAGVLQEASLLRDGRGEEESVQRWAVELGAAPAIRAATDSSSLTREKDVCSET